MTTVPVQVRHAALEIKSMNVKGAVPITITAIESLRKIKPTQLDASIRLLSNARPTEPMLRNALKFMKYRSGISGIAGAIDEFRLFHEKAKKKIIAEGARRIPQNSKVMTICHSTTVIEIFRAAKAMGKHFEVYACETRPLLQGRITARDLADSKIPVTLIVDNAMRTFMNDMQLCVVGCDAFTGDAHLVNKLGTSMMALAANESNVEFGCATELFKLDPLTLGGDVEPIEYRDSREVIINLPVISKLREHYAGYKPFMNALKGLPPSVKVKNPAFDVTPAKYIDFVITEEGVIAPQEVYHLARETYPWMFE